MNVNYFGTVAVTKAFLPFLKITKGHVVIMSSITGIMVASPLNGKSISVFSNHKRREEGKGEGEWGMDFLFLFSLL